MGRNKRKRHLSRKGRTEAAYNKARTIKLEPKLEPKYCQCKGSTPLTDEIDEFGYWDICSVCGLKKDGGYHYFNHYDGEDHVEMWFPNSDYGTED